MEKTSSSSSPSVYTIILEFFLLDYFLALFSEQVVSDFSQGLKSLFQSKSALGNSKPCVEKSLESKSNHQVETVPEKGDGKLSREDLELMMGSLGLFCSPESEKLKNSFGSDELSGLFEEEEPSLEEIKQAFDVFDQNKDGFIDAMELKRVLCILGLKEGSQIENCNKMINTCDANRDGKIDFNEFVKFMENIFC